ncbi:phospholipase A2 inhibitor and Ly6/PLAUR domain-containing protein-like [Emydura macquarii macquarii]|uniref:phospholipase A2 inhibitor and Ly6/PLAUR domain-containing protein-like n=1 Tax=Emydura macquarii macquarii TaxID=1129001 RepID=UPI00352ACC00
MWAPLSLCLLPALLATGSALLCKVCESKEESCSGPLQPCAPLEGDCVTSVAAFNLGESYFIYTAKLCLETKSCEPGSFTVTFPRNFTMRLKVSCCDTDGYNAGAIPVPSVSHVPNGRQCPACYVPGADRCKAMEILACTGAEDHCADVAGTLTAGNFTRTSTTTSKENLLGPLLQPYWDQ